MKENTGNGTAVGETQGQTAARTKLSAEAKQANYDRVYETQVKQFCFQQATQHCLTDGSQQPKAPPMSTILQNAELMFRWFKDGVVPSAEVMPFGQKAN